MSSGSGVVSFAEVGGATLSRAAMLLAGFLGGVFRAANGALIRAGETAKTRAGQYAAEAYMIRKGDFMRNVSMRASVSGGVAGSVSLGVSFAGTVLPLLAFDTRYSRGGTLVTRVKRNGGASSLRRAFAARVFGPVGVFERVGAARFPVRQLFGPSAAHMLREPEVVRRMEEGVVDTFEKRLDHEVLRIMNGWGR